MTEGRETHVDAFNSSFFFVHDDGVNIAPKDDGNGCLILALCGFAEVDHTPADACEM
jgi:hypothetical protein